MKDLLKVSFVFFVFYLNSFSQENKSIYVFGHSLIVHDPPTIPTPSDETTVPHWLHFLAEEANNSVKLSGQYGFLPNHEDRTVNSTVRAQWNFDHVEQAWDSENESFSEAGFDVILLTPANFIQYKPSNESYDGPSSPRVPLTSTLNILDWADEQSPTAVQYIYENWLNMTNAILSEDGEFPPSTAEFAKYNEVNLGSFHDWWIEYHDFIQAARPNENIKMIPVGPIISKLVTLTPLKDITAETLYEDRSPHGRPTTYFLAALITYMAIYEEKAPSTYIIPTDDLANPVSPLVQANYQGTIDFIWNELLAFNNSDGSSRVFANDQLSTVSNDYVEVNISPNPTSGIVTIDDIRGNYKIDLYDSKGAILFSKETVNDNQVDLTNLPNGIYFLRIKEKDKNAITKKIIKQ